MNGIQDLDDLAMEYVMGTMAEEDTGCFEKALSRGWLPQELREKIKEQINALSALAHENGVAVKASEKTKYALMKKIGHKKEESKAREDFMFVMAKEGTWINLPQLPGISFKTLAKNNKAGYVTFLLKMDAGAILPSHHHSHAEECYVIEGSITTRGRQLGPGDFLHAEEGSDHEPIRAEKESMALLVVAEADYDF
jgi:quercetin dioxygenase-like cupin family protein